MRLRRARKKLIKVTETTGSHRPQVATPPMRVCIQRVQGRQRGSGWRRELEAKLQGQNVRSWDPDRSEQEEVVAVGPQADRHG